MKNLFLETAGKGKNVRVQFESVIDIDLSLLQLLCSAHRTAMRLEADFIVESPMPQELQQLMRDAGFIRHSGCRFNEKNERCPWLEANCNE
jgi:hypothetical protein